MKEYQRKNQWTIPADMWMKTIWTIRGYSRYRDEVYGMLGLSAVASDGQPNGSGTGDPTFRQAAELMENYSYQMIKVIGAGSGGVSQRSLGQYPVSHKVSGRRGPQYIRALETDLRGGCSNED